MSDPGGWPENFLETWRDFLSRPRTLDDLFASPLQFPLQRRRELDAMLEIARVVGPKVVAEVGIDKGAGAWIWPHELPTVRRFIGIEVRGTPYAPLLEHAFPAVDFCWLVASSYDPATVAGTRLWLRGDRIDVLFLDGDKQNYLADFDAYLPLMAENGVVLMHDIREGQPMRDFGALQRRGCRTEMIVDTSEVGPALGRQRQGLPPLHAHDGWLRHHAGGSAGVGVIHLGGE